VLIQECKPISKTKNWMLVDVVKKGEQEWYRHKAC
jgi:ribosomal protein S17